ncbi:MAG: PfkB family carbohydrate kinase [Pirellulaceae bacterium]
MVDTLAFGEALIDVLPSGEVIGGAPLNFAIRVAEVGLPMGTSPGLMTCVGEDSRGQRIKDLLAKRGVAKQYIQTLTDRETGYVSIHLERGEASYEFSRDAAWEQIAPAPHLTHSAAGEIQLVYFGSLSQRTYRNRESLGQLLESLPNSLRLFDINLRLPTPPIAWIEPLLDQCNVLKCNSDELGWLAKVLQLEGQDPRQHAQQLLQKFALQSILHTLGEQGCVWHDSHGTASLPDAASQVELPGAASNADSVGAGDAASAMLALGLLHQWSPEETVRKCNTAGAFAARTHGPTQPVPEELLKVLRASESVDER